MAWGIIDPTPTSPATPGTRTGPTNATPRLKHQWPRSLGRNPRGGREEADGPTNATSVHPSKWTPFPVLDERARVMHVSRMLFPPTGGTS